MVGIARGKGCAVCRKRKIACGLEQPSCAQCVKSKRVCTGYRRHPIFITHQPPGDGICHVTAPTRKKAAIQPDETLLREPRPDKASFVECISSPPDGANPGSKLTSLPPLTGQMNANPAVRQQLLQEYLHHHIPREAAGLMVQRMWPLHLPDMPYMTSALEASAMALALAKLGDLYHDPALTHESLKLYNRGLRQLQKALWDPDLMFHDHTLTSCIALATYEMSQCPNKSKDAYISHTSGCAKLVELRGPEAHMEGLAHHVFIHYRTQGILYALDTRRRTFLTDPNWLEIPWRKQPKTAFDKIYDYLALAPELLAHAQMIEYLDLNKQLELGRAMLSKCWKMDKDLADIWDDMEKRNPSPLFWSELARDDASSDRSEDGKLFPVAFHFQALGTAVCVVTYWSVQALLWHGMWQLYGLMSELKLKFTTIGRIVEMDANSERPTQQVGRGIAAELFDLPPLEHRADFAAPARNIFQSMEYCLQEEMMDQGPKIAAAPLRIAMETLREYPQFESEVQWAEETMAKVQQRSLRLLIYYTGRPETG